MSFSVKNIFQTSTALGNTIWERSNKKCLRYNASILNQMLARQIHLCCNLAARVTFKLADIGEGIREVMVKEWYVNVGDKVSQFDNICEVQSDKASVTITSRYDGTISKLYYAVDDVALVGKPLVDIQTDQADEMQPQTLSTQDEEVQENEPKKSEKDELAKYLITNEVLQSTEEQTSICIPSVRRLAKEHKINLSLIKGTGKHGRILKEDILEYITKKPETKPVVPLEDRVEPIKGFKKVMVKTMTESLKIPSLMYGDEIKVTKLSELRKSLKDLSELENIKLSFLPFFIKAVSNALQRYPIINASVDENCENITYHKNHNIGIAMDTKVGLGVPIIKGVESLSIIEIAKELNRLIQSGRDGSFSPNDMVGGTFSVSNIGAIGGSYMQPIILPPQVAIIALGASQALPRFDENKNVISEEIVNISAVADHRIIDGATMGRFTQILKKQIENPYLLFLNL
ncbi:lipoamide acyltransferase component of branched-chain alpha-keto acid dehydrogenase complex, mitochondrial [Anoplophora glabripennis]|uniref:lipoamide acyltransferase component of branched-chain alpha-keto acid dehydrogenase complex, mitochondrial n=1 Tax=Anoplophora glabripennis TaxID=217634 RepID=UPI0008749233|nr:lipoamide acyltransferase component of branched-chain alpha-keto acid dehydrogenase complex, mitochondrial [Anoplophora glabripennis]